MNRPMIKAHAGCENTPQNSWQSIKAASQSGADIVELDVQCTADSKVILWHDAQAQGRLIRESSYAALIKAESEIVSFDEAIRYLIDKGMSVNLDFKTIDVCGEILRILSAYARNFPVSISGIQYGDVARIRASGLTDRFDCWVSSPYLPQGVPDQGRAAYNLEAIQSLVRLECRDLNVYSGNCDEALIHMAHMNGIRVHVWTVDDECEMCKFCAWGADSIATNRVRLLKRLVRRTI